MDVKAHYNKFRSRNETSSDMIGIRNFHNFVKATLIADACKSCHTHSRFLDLCCGNGGDIGKVKHNLVKEYFGLDIASGAVNRALQRLSEHPEVNGDVIVFNAFSATAGHLLDNLKKFDIVSCQFAIHYSFENERTARTFIQNVALALREGGSFIVTVPDEDYLSRSKKLLGKKFGDQYHCVHFESSDDFNDFGSAYEFSFTGAVEKLKEFVVKRDVLIRLCTDCGMELIDSKNFSEFARYQDTPLWKRMSAQYNPVSRIYRTFHFKMQLFHA